MVIECGTPLTAIPAVMQKLAATSFPPLPDRPEGFEVTHESVLSKSPAEHVAAVRLWANSAYESWRELREPTRNILAAL